MSAAQFPGGECPILVDARRATIKFHEYRDVEGIKIPYRMVGDVGPKKMSMKIESVTINGPVDDAKFQKPESAGDKDVEPGKAPTEERKEAR